MAYRGARPVTGPHVEREKGGKRKQRKLGVPNPGVGYQTPERGNAKFPVAGGSPVNQGWEAGRGRGGMGDLTQNSRIGPSEVAAVRRHGDGRRSRLRLRAGQEAPDSGRRQKPGGQASDGGPGTAVPEFNGTKMLFFKCG